MVLLCLQGGGPVLVPVYLALGHFTHYTAVALSNSTILAGSCANVLCNARKRHPFKNKPMVSCCCVTQTQLQLPFCHVHAITIHCLTAFLLRNSMRLEEAMMPAYHGRLQQLLYHNTVVSKLQMRMLQNWAKALYVARIACHQQRWLCLFSSPRWTGT